jgi:hypothetical protein
MNDPTDGASIDLYWLPLGAGGRSVRWNGRIYEASAAALGRRPARDLYHSALVVMQRGDSYVVEMAPVWATNGENRGVVCVGPVGARWLGRYRAFCYEVRCWRDGYIPDVAAAVDSPQRVSNSPDQVAGLFDVVRLVPSLTWGRDEIGSSEMWNSNSLVSWLLAETGLDMTAIHPPAGGRAPGWHAGLALAAAPLAARRSIRVSRRGLGRVRRSDRALRLPRRARSHPRLLESRSRGRWPPTVAQSGVRWLGVGGPRGDALHCAGLVRRPG